MNQMTKTSQHPLRAKSVGGRGFTLIELLVVIAIIGVLSAVILVSLHNTSRQGIDSAVKANLATLASAAELYDNANGQYVGESTGTDCNMIGDNSSDGLWNDPTFVQSFEAAATAVQPVALLDNRCFISPQEWMVAVSRPAERPALPSSRWCVDSIGHKCGTDSDDPSDPYRCLCTSYK